MSKCREAFMKHFGHPMSVADPVSVMDWKAAWNARGKLDAEICESAPERMTGFGTYVCDGASCAEAIEQEQCE